MATFPYLANLRVLGEGKDDRALFEQAETGDLEALAVLLDLMEMRGQTKEARQVVHAAIAIERWPHWFYGHDGDVLGRDDEIAAIEWLNFGVALDTRAKAEGAVLPHDRPGVFLAAQMYLTAMRYSQVHLPKLLWPITFINEVRRIEVNHFWTEDNRTWGTRLVLVMTAVGGKYLLRPQRLSEGPNLIVPLTPFSDRKRQETQIGWLFARGGVRNDAVYRTNNLAAMPAGHIG